MSNIGDTQSASATRGTATNAWSLRRLVAHHVLPGAAGFAVYILLAWMVRGSWIPLMAALFLSVLLGEVPMSWYLMLRASKAEGTVGEPRALFPWRERTSLAVTVGVGLVLAVFGMIVVFGVASSVEPLIREPYFGWVPEWLNLQSGPAAMSQFTRSGLLLVWALSGVVGIVIGGTTQELYHRGFLLPRASYLGPVAVPLNAALFAMSHFAAPWGWPFFFFGSLAWAAAVYRWRSVQIGLVGHLGMLTLGWLMMTAMLLGVVTPPTK